MCQNQQNQFNFSKEKENLFFFLGQQNYKTRVATQKVDYFFFFFGHGQLEFQCFLEAGKWNRSSFWTWASGISVPFGNLPVESQFTLDAAKWNLRSFWAQAHGISGLFGRRHVESQFFLDAGTWNLSSFGAQTRGILAGTQVSCSCQQAADLLERLIGSPKLILVSFLRVFPNKISQ